MTEIQTFEALRLSETRLAAIEALGWERPTPIQWQAIPTALQGRDVVGIAQTGTGKTGAFMIPALEGIQAGGGLQVLVLCPTRELAQQVADDTLTLAEGTRIRCSAIYGGVSYGPQLDALQQGWEVIVATPGRFIDHLERGRVDLKRVTFLVLDEADRMLDMGFRPDIEKILRALPGKRQTMLFSATMPNGVHDLALRITKEALWIEAARSGTMATGITELVYSVKPEKKPDLLVHLLKHGGWDHVLVFTRTKVGADVLVGRLGREGFKSDVMHSDRQMKHRTKALDDFAQRKIRVLVATDIAQRGLDVEGITHVVNYDVPLDPEDYVHRVGRTARAGAVGTAVTFVTAGDLGALRTLEHHLGRDLPRERIEGYDYAGAPPAEDGSGERRHQRSARGMGTKSAEELSPEELEKLLGFG
jgi:ATP-dependent RNA helicase RhlE